MLTRRMMLVVCGLMLMACSAQAFAKDLNLTLRRQVPIADGFKQFHTVSANENWDPKATAIILCDVWDSHTCANAVERLTEFLPRLNETVIALRKAGVTVIHAPSDCMEFYKEHPARLRAMNLPKAAVLPNEITKWCYKIPAEEHGVYPIDQTDGGNDDTPEQKVEWKARLIAEGRNPGRPWIRQNAAIAVDDAQDFISDKGDEVWSILESRGIKNVIVTGVHTNMCVLGRPFALRRMVENGKNAVLLRDTTDTMYNPKSAPYVNHFIGTDLIISHIERHVCPSISSDQIVGGKPFRSARDTRPHVVVLASESEYDTHRTLTDYAVPNLGKTCKVSFVYGYGENENQLRGIEVLKDADLLLISVRRRTPPKEQLAVVQQFIRSGKPVVGIRTSSHPFSLRKGEAPEGHGQWPEFDAEVWGGHYTNHYGDDLKTTVHPVPGVQHPVLTGLSGESFASGGTLYRTAPLAEGTTVLMMGEVPEKMPEPLSWVYTRKDGGKSFYTSLGHESDFANPAFVRMLTNAVHWGLGLPVSGENPATSAE